MHRGAPVVCWSDESWYSLGRPNAAFDERVLKEIREPRSHGGALSWASRSSRDTKPCAGRISRSVQVIVWPCFFSCQSSCWRGRVLLRQTIKKLCVVVQVVAHCLRRGEIVTGLNRPRRPETAQNGSRYGSRCPIFGGSVLKNRDFLKDFGGAARI